MAPHRERMSAIADTPWQTARATANAPPAAVTRGGADPRCREGQLAVPPSICCNSPLWYISIMMSEPPMNSPFTYSWGMVGQLL